MKKNFIKKFVLVGGILVATVGLLTGCGKKKEETKTYDKENETVVSNKEIATNKDNTVSTELNNVNENNVQVNTNSNNGGSNSNSTSEVRSISGWEDAYKNKLKTTEQEAKAEQGNMYSDYEDNYSIHDINNDGIPELLVYKGTSEADWTLEIYTYKNKNLEKLGNMSFSHSAMYIMYDGNYLKLVHGQMGYESVYKVYINSNGELVKEKTSERELAEGEDYEEGDQYLDTFAYSNFEAIDYYTNNY